MVEQATHNRSVTGSNPVTPTGTSKASESEANNRERVGDTMATSHDELFQKLSSDGYLINLRFSTIGTDALFNQKSALSETAQKAGLRAKKSRINEKFLVPITKCKATIRAAIKFLCVPFMDSTYWAPTESLDRIRREYIRGKGQFEAETNSFIQRWPEIIDEARSRLGEYFDEQDYPSSRELRSKFGIRLRQFKLMRPEVEIDPHAIQDMADGFASEVSTILRERFAELLKSISSKLVRKGNRQTALDDNVVDKLGDFLGMVHSLNVSNDRELTELIDRVRTFCDTHELDSAYAFQGTEKHRRNIQATFDDVSRTLLESTVTRGARRFM